MEYLRSVFLLNGFSAKKTNQANILRLMTMKKPTCVEGVTDRISKILKKEIIRFRLISLDKN